MCKFYDRGGDLIKNGKFQAIHVMADGSVLNSIEGIVIAVNEKTKPFYQLLAEFLKRDKQVIA